jgi:anti-sigma B factor antagonist
MTNPEQPGSLQVLVRSEGSDFWVEAHGEIDISTSAQWEKAITDGLTTAPDRLYVDMHLVSFIDSSGLAVLVRCHSRAGKQDSALIVRSPSRQVERVLALAGLKEHLTIEP